LATDKEILKEFAEKLVPELKEVSGRFADSIEYELEEDVLTVYASPYISTLIDGRPPTSSNATKGNPTLQQIIRKWIDQKGIIPQASPSGKVPTLEQLSWAISKSIHMKGDLLYQRGGGNNIFDGIITETRMKNLLNLVGEKYFNEINTINLPRIST
jgi:hypothetical protein